MNAGIDIRSFAPVDVQRMLSYCLPPLRDLAISDDVAGRYPQEAMALLGREGLLNLVLGPVDGGIGLGWRPAATTVLFNVLVALGGAHLSVARLYEGHVNAFALLWSYGDDVQRQRLVTYVREGGVLGVWNAPSPTGPLVLTHGVLRGEKIYCSGAGNIARPLITADRDGELLMLWPDAADARVDLSGWKVHGMRATATGTVSFDGVSVSPDDIFGDDNAYHREPAFSGGAWRFVAAQLGAAGALVDLMRERLQQSHRDGDAHQRARLADAAMHLETGRLWTYQAAQRASAAHAGKDALAYVRMARLVVEKAAMDIAEGVQRSIGLRAMMQADPIERIVRDLATYLRQPVPDAIRDAVAGDVLSSRLPLLDRWSEV